jgi:hypothetical protein
MWMKFRAVVATHLIMDIALALDWWSGSSSRTVMILMVVALRP